MLNRFLSLTAVLLLSVFLLQNCATTGYKTAMETGSKFENKNQYIKAYKNYKKALDEKPEDKDAAAKLDELSGIIAEEFVNEGNKQFQEGRYRDAEESFNSALNYRKGYDPAISALSDMKAALKKNKEMYAYADELKAGNNWLEAVSTLKKVHDKYQDDPDLPARIDKFEKNGYKYYRELAVAARENASYKESSDFLQMAQQLKDTIEIKQDIALINNYLQAEGHYDKALALSKKNALEEAVNQLDQARKLVSDHKKSNLLYAVLLKEWSGILILEGEIFMDRMEYQEAYDVFKKLYDYNPKYPKAEYYYTESRTILLKSYYTSMVDSLKKNKLPAVVAYGNHINTIEPGFIDTHEIMNSAVLKVFNMYYQKGLHYLAVGDYGKAILAFRSAEEQVGETVMTQNGIDNAGSQIMDATRLKIAFWNFFNKNGESGISGHATSKLKDKLKIEEIKFPLKNIMLEYDIINDEEMAIRADQNSIDWGLIQSKECNSLFSGKIELLRIDTSRKSEWKTRVHKKNKIVDNKEYLALVIKLAKLKNAQINKSKNLEVDGKIYEKKDYKKEIRTIETILPGISPKVEAEIEETSSYLVETHVMKAFVQIDVNIFYQNGSPLWPSKSYQDEFVIEDSVISPDLQSAIPEERTGDPLVLPSKYEFMKMAIDHIIEKKIVPDLYKKFNDYGIRFYETAKKLAPMSSTGTYFKDSDDFRNAVEEYYKFLVSYKDKGQDDIKPENVSRYLDSLISDEWILKRAEQE